MNETGNLYFLAAAAMSLVTCLVHTFAGGRLIARPLLASDLRRVVKQAVYFCWHMTTAALIVMAGAFAWAAVDESQRGAATAGAALAAAYLALNVGQNLVMGNSFARHPQWTFFLVITALGGAGLLYG